MWSDDIFLANLQKINQLIRSKRKINIIFAFRKLPLTIYTKTALWRTTKSLLPSVRLKPNSG